MGSRPTRPANPEGIQARFALWIRYLVPAREARGDLTTTGRGRGPTLVGVRVYLPSTMTAARAALERRAVPAGTAFAVTPAVREWYALSGDEEMEYAMLLAAARASLRLLDAEPAAPRRRLVFAIDVAQEAVRVRDDLDRGVVEVTSETPWTSVRAVHVDEEAAQVAVTAAAAAIVEADLGGEEAAFVVDEADGYDLLWFATQELAELLGGAGR